MGKQTICIGENKGADQLRSNCEADQRLCFRYTDITIPLLSLSKISSLLPSSVLVQPGLCRTWSEPKLLDFSRTGSNGYVFNNVSAGKLWTFYAIYTNALHVNRKLSNASRYPFSSVYKNNHAR